ncbi:MAG: hypothetical protein AB2421_00690 [Thermotaleaceae bacterium]
MNSWLELFQRALYTLLKGVLNPLFWVVIYIVYIQYRRIFKMEISILGRAKHSLKDKLIRAIWMGLFGGTIGTFLIILLGITIESLDFVFLLPLAIFLMIFNVRYVCFSYAGGLMSLCSLIFKVPAINVSSLMAIVAILHLIESVLIWIDGDRDATPIFIEDKCYGVIGGFSLQRFWPIPLTILVMMIGVLEGAQEIYLPNWWPLFSINQVDREISNRMFQLSLIVAALGYGDMTLSRTPKEKSKKSSLRLLGYSILLLSFAGLSTQIYVFKWIAALFAPLAHEALILYGQKEERRLPPIFRNYKEGITILDVFKGEIGEKMGLEQGDVILRINNQIVVSQESIKEILKDFPPYVWIEIRNRKGIIKTIEYKDYRKGIRSIGIVVVPQHPNIIFQAQDSFSIGKRLIHKDFGNKKTTM